LDALSEMTSSVRNTSLFINAIHHRDLVGRAFIYVRRTVYYRRHEFSPEPANVAAMAMVW